MLTLDTPIIIYPDTYDAMIPVRFEVDFRGQRGDFVLGLVKRTDTAITVGTEEHTDAGVRFLHPEPMYTITLSQNMQSPDPLLSDLMQSLVLWLENLDPTFAELVAPLTKQLGLREWSLAGQVTTLGDRAVTHEIVELRSAPLAARASQRSPGPFFSLPLRTVHRTGFPGDLLPFSITVQRHVQRTVGPWWPDAARLVATVTGPTSLAPVRAVAQTTGPQWWEPLRTVQRTIDPTVLIS